MHRRTIQGIIFILITVLLSVLFLSGHPAYATSTGVTYATPEKHPGSPTFQHICSAQLENRSRRGWLYYLPV